MIEKFFQKNTNLETLIQNLKSDENLIIEDGHKVAKFLRNFCFTWEDCLLIARNKFEKYFSNKAKDILNIYPVDHLMSDGSPFWKLPKRQPNPVKFDSSQILHLEFVTSLARLLAEIFNVNEINQDDLERIKNFLNENESKVPAWQPSKKHIETDESKKKMK